MDKNALASALTDLHITVLEEILKGEPFDFIREKYALEFDLLDYESILVEKANRLTFDDNGHLIGAYPVSPIPTAHKMTIAGIGTGYAMCAIDALGATHTFGAPVSVETEAKDTGKSVQFTISADNIPQTDLVVSYDPLDHDSFKELVAANDQLATDACPVINFYSSEHSVPKDLKTMDFETAINASRDIFDRKAIQEHLRASLG